MKRDMGKVYLIGAGPGDMGLITLKGWQVLSRVDVLVYDELIHPELLKQVPERCRLIYAGKKANRNHISQSSINQMLVRYATKGYTVGRLKGGDPYLFGRGAEEGEYLNRHRISFEVIPGVTSASGCAAYAGIPLTDRQHASTVCFITAHRASSKNGQGIPWEALREAADTLVIYMGATQLKRIQEQLLKHRWPKKTPVALIQWGTWEKQRSCRGTLQTMNAMAARHQIGSPAIVVVGQVVSLSAHLNWFEKQALFGKRILLTRASKQAEELQRELAQHGAQPILCPTIEIHPPRKFSECDKAIRNLKDFDWIVFTSVNGVDGFFDRLQKKHRKDTRALGGVRIAVVGPGTRDRLKHYGVKSDFCPTRYTTDSLFQELRRNLKTLQGKQFLLIRPKEAP